MSPRWLLLPLLCCLHLCAFAQAAYTLVFGPENSLPAAIDNAGRIAGQVAGRAFVQDGGMVRDLGTLGGPASSAAAINDAGQIAGTSFVDGDVQHAFLYTDGVLQDIGSLGGAFTEARALNEAGQVVGYSTYADTEPGTGFSSAFVFRDGLMLDLNLVTERPGVWTILDAFGINDSGQIAAYACTGFGDCRAVRLDPIPAVPEPRPAALWFTGAGLGLAGVLRRRRLRVLRGARRTAPNARAG
jgi:probable HAF family extracellular repeat protein